MGTVRKKSRRSSANLAPNTLGAGTLTPATPPVTASQCEAVNSTMKWAASVAIAR